MSLVLSFLLTWLLKRGQSDTRHSQFSHCYQFHHNWGWETVIQVRSVKQMSHCSCVPTPHCLSLHPHWVELCSPHKSPRLRYLWMYLEIGSCRCNQVKTGTNPMTRVLQRRGRERDLSTVLEGGHLQARKTASPGTKSASILLMDFRNWKKYISYKVTNPMGLGPHCHDLIWP